MMEINKAASVKNWLVKYILVVLLIGVAMVMIGVNQNFLTPANLINILRNIAIQGILACGMTMVLIGGELDLSFGSTIGLTSLIITIFCDKVPEMTGMSIDVAAIIAICIALGCSVLFGLANAYFITKWKMPSMVVTLGMQFVIYGIGGALSEGYSFFTLPKWWSVFGTDKIGSIPICVLIFLAVFLIFFMVMSKTKFGRKIYAVGGNAEAARLSGINVRKTKYSIMVIMQLCACLGGIILSSQIFAGQVSYGKGMEMTVIAAAVIGGASISGGRGTMIGTLLGVLFLGVINNAMTVANIGDYPQYIVRGGLVIFAMLLNVLQTRENIKHKKVLKQ